ncbi:MAG: hypothetical protein HQL27_04785 [Candidatus Omnitrophica bacterium]|nr:hypothetical protein [Candidatus Omnitrophota bacterium]
MKRIVAVLIIILFLSAAFSYAHPPKDMKLVYDKATGVLRVEMKHVTTDIIDHRIREIQVSKSGAETQKIKFPKQTSPQGVSEDIPFTAAAGDTIKVKAICNQAGSLEGEVAIPKEKGAASEAKPESIESPQILNQEDAASKSYSAPVKEDKK